MALAVPVAVRFLQRGNRELSRNMSSYLSLAAIAKADLLAEHTEAITVSVLGGTVYIRIVMQLKAYYCFFVISFALEINRSFYSHVTFHIFNQK